MPLKTIGEWSIERLEILDEQGEIDADLAPDLGPDELLGIYRAMLLAREADTRMLKLQRQGRIGTFALCTGQEACAVGPAVAMGPDDWFVGAFRELGGRLVRGEPLASYLLAFNGYEEGNVLPAEGAGRILPTSVIVGSQTLHAVGISYAMRYQGESAAVVVFLGDGATSEGDFHEALNFAGVWQTPTVFICANNQWAISMPRSKQTQSETIAQKAIAHGVHGIQVDGNDALAMYKATAEALERARSGGGPTLIEALTYRLMMHTTADDQTKYRPEEEEQEWWQREPLIRMRRYLESEGLIDDQRQAAMEEEIKQEIEAAVTEFEARTDFKPDVAFDHVFGNRNEEIEEQRAEFLAELQEDAASGQA